MADTNRDYRNRDVVNYQTIMTTNTGSGRRYEEGDELTELRIEEVEKKDFFMYLGACEGYGDIHADSAAVEESGQSTIFAPGAQILGYAANMVARNVGFENVKQLQGRFTHPVAPGDSIRITGVVTNKTHCDGYDAVEIDLHIANQTGQVVMTGEGELHLEHYAE